MRLHTKTARSYMDLAVFSRGSEWPAGLREIPHTALGC